MDKRQPLPTRPALPSTLLPLPLPQATASRWHTPTRARDLAAPGVGPTGRQALRTLDWDQNFIVENLPRLQPLTHPLSLTQEIRLQIAQTHMQRSCRYVRVCIYVNLLSLFLDIMSYLIMVTSVEEDSSFPLPEQNPVQGSCGEPTCCRVYGRRAKPTRNQPRLPHGPCCHQQPAAPRQQHHVRHRQTTS